MHRDLVPAATAALLTFCAASSSTLADDVRCYAKTTADGVTIEQQYTPGLTEACAADGGGWMMTRGGEIIWQSNLDQAIYTTSGISVATNTAVGATRLNPPLEVECFKLEGDGTPSWVYPGTEFQVATARRGDTIAGADLDAVAERVTVYKWTAASETPDWSYTIEKCDAPQYRRVTVSSDGSTIAVLVRMTGDNPHSRVFCFAADSPTPILVYDGLDGSSPRDAALTEHGGVVAINSSAMIHVVDVATGVERDVLSVGASADPLTMSGDGTYVGYGWSRFTLCEWNGSDYVPLWSRAITSHYLSKCKISLDGSTLVLGFNRNDYHRNLIELFEIPSNEPVWSYSYDVGTGYQDLPSDLAITDNGSHVAVASWGDSADTNPEVHVFEHAVSEPVYTLNTPGSMFDIDIAAGVGSIYVTACGKHVHANQSGRGGDMYAIRLPGGGVLGDLDGDGDVDLADLAQLLAHYGMTSGAQYEDGDLDGDGDVDLADLASLLAVYGTGE